MKVYIIAHKDFDNPTNDNIYCPLQVGTQLNGVINDEWMKDNTGENISDKNLSYNELTGLYWIWKNSSEDIAGLCHYRRYFVNTLGKVGNLVRGNHQGFLKEDTIRKILENRQLIVHNKTFFREGCRQQYKSGQKYPDDIEILRDVLQKVSPDYVDAYDSVMNGKTCHLLNMMIGKKDIVDSYCKWLFDVLFEVESQLRDNGETGFDRRMGMLGERMLDIWIKRNEIRVKEMFTINTERKDWKMW